MYSSNFECITKFPCDLLSITRVHALGYGSEIHIGMLVHLPEGILNGQSI